jgi:hypothetical protein
MCSQETSEKPMAMKSSTKLEESHDSVLVCEPQGGFTYVMMVTMNGSFMPTVLKKYCAKKNQHRRLRGVSFRSEGLRWSNQTRLGRRLPTDCIYPRIQPVYVSSYSC